MIVKTEDNATLSEGRATDGAQNVHMQHLAVFHATSDTPETAIKAMKKLDPQYPTFAVLALLAAAQLSNAWSLSTASSLPARKPWTKAKSLSRRATENKSIPEPISIAPSQYWEGNDGPWSTFPLQVGSGAVGGLQNVRVMISTAATAIWTIASEGCPNDYVKECPTVRGGLFMRNQSLTWAPDSIYQTGLEMNLGLDSSGYVGYDVATLGWQGSGAEVTNEHSIIWNMADSNYWTGVFGMNPRPTNLTDFSSPQTSFMQSLFNSKDIPSVSYGYTAGNRYRLDGVYGSLTLGGYDQNRFIPTDVTFPFYEDISRDLSVNLHAIATSKGTPSNLLPDGSISIFIDSTVPELWLPESACAAFEEAFGIQYDNDLNRYTISSSTRQRLLTQDAEITLMIGPEVNGGETVDITLPYSAFDLQLGFPIISVNSSSRYYFPLQRATNSTQYTLGRTFLQEAYLIADYERQNFSVSQCGWEEEKVSSQKVVSIISSHLNTSSISSADERAKVEGKDEAVSKAAIAGVAVAVVVFVALIGLMMFFFRRRNAARKRRQAELEEQEKAARHADHGRPHISYPVGGELDNDGTAVYEISAGSKAHEMDSHYDIDRNKYGYSEMQGQEFIGPGKGFATEIGSTAIYELDGSDARVPELEATRTNRQRSGRGGFV
ncbi:hypothetical protein LTR37_018456 [Vermiconidia calcicola]|uniref:Uncharacterized protein n=1 Tax=Vermiconidia calcicola TaxID=1690605 RepID=A0ACC3MIC5_9PEZI|nr:hypothetical protein LTR37_018456 [Vermiconidia calcicola]